MTFSITTRDGVTVLVIEGELDAVSVSDLADAVATVLAKKPTFVELDLGRLRMIDSSGVGALVSLYKKVRSWRGEVRVSGLRDQPLAVFRLLRLDLVMTGAGPPSAT